MQNYNYESAYYQTSQVDVRASYTIPAGTTIVEQYSIPATKKVIIPKEVETIKGDPFAYPEYVEEIVFEDADNGSLKTVGSDSSWFFLSFTKIKNFVLPKTVEKLYIGTFHLTTEMNLLDISSCSNITSTEFEMMKSEGKGDNNLPKLLINAPNFIKEFNYIHTLRLPQANMDFICRDLGGGSYNYNERIINMPQLSYDIGEISADASIPDIMNNIKTQVEEYGFTFCTEAIDNLYYPNVSTDLSIRSIMRDCRQYGDKTGIKGYYYTYINNIYAKESIYDEFKGYVQNFTQNNEFNTYFTVCEVKMVVESWYNKALYCTDGDGYIATRLDGCTLDENDPDYDKILLSMTYDKYEYVITLSDTENTLTKTHPQYPSYNDIFYLIEHDDKTYVCLVNFYDENSLCGWLTFEDDRVLWHIIDNNYKVEFVTVWRLQTI